MNISPWQEGGGGLLVNKLTYIQFSFAYICAYLSSSLGESCAQVLGSFISWKIGQIRKKLLEITHYFFLRHLILPSAVDLIG